MSTVTGARAYPGAEQSRVPDAQPSPPCGCGLSEVFHSLPDAAAIVDSEGAIIDVNSSWSTFSRLNGGDPMHTGTGANYLRACEQAAADGGHDAAAVAEGLHGVLSNRLRSFEHRYPCPSPIEDRWFVVRITPLPGVRGALVIHLDVTAAKLTEERLEHRATHDPLTGLPNGESVLSALRAALARRTRSGNPVAVLFLDLDGFKPVNDRYGHEAGNRFFIQVANRLQRQLRENDLVGRVGGDEFVAVCDAAQARTLADRLRGAVSTPFQVGGDSVRVGVSIGVAIAAAAAGQGTEHAARALLAEADRAMYADKRDRNREPLGTDGRDRDPRRGR